MTEAQQGDLTVTGEVAGFAKDAGGFLRSMEAHRVFRIDEIDPPRGVALRLEHRGQLGVG